jgi:hypothetical protein
MADLAFFAIPREKALPGKELVNALWVEAAKNRFFP